jgi:hypothetical protein
VLCPEGWETSDAVADPRNENPSPMKEVGFAEVRRDYAVRVNGDWAIKELPPLKQVQ